MKFKTLCRLKKDELVYDQYSNMILTVDDAILIIQDTWLDYDGDLYPIVNVNQYGIPDLNLDMTLEFANTYASDMRKIKIES